MMRKYTKILSAATSEGIGIYDPDVGHLDHVKSMHDSEQRNEQCSEREAYCDGIPLHENQYSLNAPSLT